MSLLGTPVYANNATPLWLSTQGDVVTGDITFTSPNSVNWVDASGNIVGRIVGVDTGAGSPPPNTLYIQNNDTIAFGQVGQSNYNTSLAIDAFGGEDALIVNGLVQTTNLALKDDQSVGVGTITVGTTSTNITFNAPLLGVPYVFLTFAGAASAGPGAGNSQGVLTVTNLSTTGFTVTLTDANGVVKAAQNVNAVFMWLAVIHD